MDDVQARWARAEAPEAGDRLLTEHERARLAAFRRPEDRAMFRSAHVLVRVLVAELAGVSASAVDVVQRCRRCGRPHGSPSVLIDGRPGPEVSFSHAGGLVLAAVAGAPVGVDLEPLGGVRAGVERLALSSEEQALLAARPRAERPDALTRWWVRKEAVLKAADIGLAEEPNEVVVSPPWEPARLVRWPAAPADYALVDLDGVSGWAAALAVRASVPPVVDVRELDLRHLC